MIETLDNRTKILSIAFKLFFEKGYKEVTMSQLVRESGLSKGAFYHYFSSKEELYNCSMEMFIDQYLKDFQIEFNDGLTLRENLKGLFKQITPISKQINNSSQEKAEALSNYLIFLQSLMRKEEWRLKMEEYNMLFINQLSSAVKKAQEGGDVNPSLDPVLLARHFTSLMKGVGVLHTFVEQRDQMEEVFNSIVDQFFDLIEVTK